MEAHHAAWVVASAAFLPVPSGGYLTFRLVTQYGADDHPVVVDDVLNYLAWCKRNDGVR